MNELSHLGLDEDGNPVKKGRGCFFWGCMTMLLLAFLGLLVFGGLSYLAYRQLDQGLAALEPYVLDEKPGITPTVIEKDSFETMEKEWDEFLKNCRSNTSDQLIISESDLAGLLFGLNHQASFLIRETQIDFKPPQIHVDTIIEFEKLAAIDFLGMLNKHQLLDKYVHGSVVLKPAVVGGTPGVYIMKARMIGKETISIPVQGPNGEVPFIALDQASIPEVDTSIFRCISAVKVTDEGMQLNFNAEEE